MNTKKTHRAWSEEEILFLLENHLKYTCKEFAQYFKRSESSIKGKIRDYGISLKKSESFNWYSKEDIQYLRLNHDKKSMYEIGKNIGKTTSSVRHKLLKLGLKGIRILNSHTEEEFLFIKENFNKYSNKELSELMGIKERRVEIIITKLNLKRKYNTDIQNSEWIVCPSCKNILAKNCNNFYYSKGGRIHTSNCINCSKTKSRQYATKTSRHYLSVLLTGIKGDESRRYKNDKECDLDIEFLCGLLDDQKGICNITGLKMTHDRDSIESKRTNISIDRIDSKKGYTKDNVQLVCFWANIFKRDLTMSELKYYVEKIYLNLK